MYIFIILIFQYIHNIDYVYIGIQRTNVDEEFANYLLAIFRVRSASFISTRKSNNLPSFYT